VESILAVIPVFNHGRTLRSVVEQTLARHPHVLVIDDGSTDNGCAELDGVSCRIISHPENRGKGAAILTAAAEAKAQGFTHIITLDADGQHSADDLPAFLDAIAATPHAVYIGARDFTVPNVPGASKFGREFSRFWLRVQTGWDVSDPQSGFRAYPVSLLTTIRFREQRYAFEIEVLAKAAWTGFPLRSLPISVYYPIAEERVSHFSKLHDNVAISLLNTRLTMRAMLPIPHRRVLEAADGSVSVRHPLRSLRLLLRNQATPSELALSAALGMLLGTLPLVGLHSISILLVAGYMRLNKICGLAVSQLCMPPLVPALCIEVGYYLRHGSWLTDISLETLGYQALDRLYEWVLGSLVVAPALAVCVAALVYALALLAQFGLAGVSHD
jgi:glycosyltransferase involved in cell wall biosynthesis